MMSAGVAVRQDHESEKEICILFDVTLKTAPQRHSWDVCYMVGVCVGDAYPGRQDPDGVWETNAPVTLEKAGPGSEISVTVEARSHLCLKACMQVCQVMLMPAGHAGSWPLRYTIADFSIATREGGSPALMSGSADSRYDGD